MEPKTWFAIGLMLVALVVIYGPIEGRNLDKFFPPRVIGSIGGFMAATAVWLILWKR